MRQDVRDYLDITPLDIQQRQFHTRFRGFDTQEVDDFLDQIAHTLDRLYAEIERLKQENANLTETGRALSQKEELAREQVIQFQNQIEQLRENARKSSDAILAEAELKREQIITRAYSRIAEVHEDIIRLKTRRIQFETQIRSMIDSHIKLLDMEKQQMEAMDQEFDRIRHGAPSEGQPLYNRPETG